MRVMCCGDSITLGTGNAGPAYWGGYRRHLMSSFRGVPFVGSQEAYSGTPTYGQCEGYGGATTATIKTNVLANGAGRGATVLLWMSGTNDVSNGTFSAAAIYAAALNVHQTLGTEKLILAPPPIRKTTDLKYAESVTAHGDMNTYVAGLGTLPAGVYYYDTSAAAGDSWFNDTVHPNNTVGYPALAAGWLAAMLAAGITAPAAPTGSYDTPAHGGCWL